MDDDIVGLIFILFSLASLVFLAILFLQSLSTELVWTIHSIN
jgi:hypothetical protein